jgi:hypothetical protein
MQKKIYFLCLAITIIFCATSGYAQKGKSEFTVGYGHFSSYAIANDVRNNGQYIMSTGATVFGYKYFLSRNVTIGLDVAYEDLSDWATITTVSTGISIAYLDTRNAPTRIKLYGAGYFGVSILGDYRIRSGETNESGPKPWGGQFTPFGVRIGRQFAIFAEIGYGYKGMLHGGLSLRVPRVMHHRERAD